MANGDLVRDRINELTSQGVSSFDIQNDPELIKLKEERDKPKDQIKDKLKDKSVSKFDKMKANIDVLEKEVFKISGGDFKMDPLDSSNRINMFNKAVTNYKTAIDD